MNMKYMKDANGNMLSAPHAEPNAETLSAMRFYIERSDDRTATLLDRACRSYIDMCLCQEYARAEIKEHNGTKTNAYKVYHLNNWYNAGKYAVVLDMLKVYSGHEKNDNTWANRIINICEPTITEIHRAILEG